MKTAKQIYNKIRCKKNFKLILSCVLALALVMTAMPLTGVVSVAEGADFTGLSSEAVVSSLAFDVSDVDITGTGTDFDPYLIYTAAGLRAFADKVNGGETEANAILMADIDLNPGFAYDIDENGTISNVRADSEVQTWKPMGSYSSRYSGTFDGDGHTISGIYVNSPNGNYAGLFGRINGGIVKNLGIVNSCINVTSSGSIYAGGVVGDNSDSGTIQDCYNTGAVSANGTPGGASVGGVVGYNYEGTIQDCYNTGAVFVSSTGDYAYAGGVVGRNYGSISSCYNTGDVSATASGESSDAEAGGVAGCNNSGTLTNCYNTGAASASSTGGWTYAGGVVGLDSKGTITSCYYLSGCVTSAGTICDIGTALTIEQMTGTTALDNMIFSDPTLWVTKANEELLAVETDTEIANITNRYLPQLAVFSEIPNVIGYQNIEVLEYKIISPSTSENTLVVDRETTNENHLVGLDETANTVADIKAALQNNSTQIIITRGDTVLSDTDRVGTGCVVKCVSTTDPTVVYESATVILYGDINGDGLIDSTDHMLMYNQTILMQDEIKADSVFFMAADMNGDGYLDIIDYFIQERQITGTGTGTDSDLYLIYNAEQLRAFADKVNNGETGINGKLMADIDLNPGFAYDIDENGTISNVRADSEVMSWTPIGLTSEAAYQGVFDGNGHTVSGMYIDSAFDKNVGLFGHVDGGTVQNLGLVNSCINVTSSSDIYAGGVAGYNSSGTITSCYNTGTVSATTSGQSNNARAGGVSGYNRGIIQNCYNTGAVFASSTTGDAYAGGVAGRNYGSISSCYNEGDVSASSTGGWAYAGGVAGENNVTIQNCYNTGAVVASSTTRYACAGGVVGVSIRSTINCYNTGAVVASSTAGAARVGGVVGQNAGTIQDCYNTGTVSATASGDYSVSAGGVAGDNLDTITNCYNTGDVSASSIGGWTYVGGVIGSGGGLITNCHNTGTISATASGESSDAIAGGVAGWNSNGTITNCYNTGAVSATTSGESDYAEAGGVVGDNSDSGTIQNCYNTGTVSASSTGGDAYAGGVVGWNSSGTLTNCYNTGAVSASGTRGWTYAGGVVGKNSRGTITSCYYLKGCVTSGDTICNKGKALTIEQMTGTTALDNMVFTDPTLWVTKANEELLAVETDTEIANITNRYLPQLAVFSEIPNVIGYQNIEVLEYKIISPSTSENTLVVDRETTNENHLVGLDETANTVAEIKADLQNNGTQIIVTKGDTVLSDTDRVGTGCVVKCVSTTDSTVVYESATVILYGDINGDGLIDDTDHMSMYNQTLLVQDEITADSVFFMAADMNGDGYLDIMDYFIQERQITGTYLFDQAVVLYK